MPAIHEEVREEAVANTITRVNKVEGVLVTESSLEKVLAKERETNVKQQLEKQAVMLREFASEKDQVLVTDYT